ncbi:MAG: hypothetical protein ACRC7N_12060 [Clostridium sp.]
MNIKKTIIVLMIPIILAVCYKVLIVNKTSLKINEEDVNSISIRYESNLEIKSATITEEKNVREFVDFLNTLEFKKASSVTKDMVNLITIIDKNNNKFNISYGISGSFNFNDKNYSLSNSSTIEIREKFEKLISDWNILQL